MNRNSELSGQNRLKRDEENCPLIKKALQVPISPPSILSKKQLAKEIETEGRITFEDSCSSDLSIPLSYEFL
jgi:hypothetical protein